MPDSAVPDSAAAPGPPGAQDVADAHDALRRDVQAALDAFLDARAKDLAVIGPELDTVMDVVRRFTAGGKRLRPAFCVAGWRAAGRPWAPGDGIGVAAAALELLQASALVHDDLMDNSDTRRGAPAVHRQYTAWHADRGLLGDGDRFGRAAALLTGDVCLTWTEDMFRSAGLHVPARAWRVFEDMRTDVVAGQYLDMLAEVSPRGSASDEVDRARRVVLYKSAKYSIEQPLLLGAALGGAGEPLLAGLSEFGLAVGEAFQLRDDVLGVFGDPATTGKPAGDDLREGKRTLLVELTRSALDEAGRRDFDGAFGRADLSAADLADLRGAITATGALRRVEDRVDALGRGSDRILAGLPVPDDARAVLGDLARRATHRSA